MVLGSDPLLCFIFAPCSLISLPCLVIQVTEELLHAAFIPFGNIQEVQIPKDFKENANRGFGFVQFYSEEDAAAAMDNMDGSELEVRRLFGASLGLNSTMGIYQFELGPKTWTSASCLLHLNLVST